MSANNRPELTNSPRDRLIAAIDFICRVTAHHHVGEADGRELGELFVERLDAYLAQHHPYR
jgi:hypothetical protein